MAEALFTNCHHEGKASTVDYIFHSASGIELVGLWEHLPPEVIMPDLLIPTCLAAEGDAAQERGGGVQMEGRMVQEEGIGQYVGRCGLPNKDWGSDHLALCVQFQLV